MNVSKKKRQDQAAIKNIVGAFIVGALVAAAASQGSVDAAGLPVFALCGVLAFAINLIVYIPAQIKQSEKFFDATGASTYLTITAVAVVLADDLDARAAIAAAMVVIWACRLGSFLFLRIRRDGGDNRFDRIKTDPLQFSMTWIMQGLWVLLTVSAALAVITSTQNEPIGVLAIIGIVVWATGFGIEIVADAQKSAFRSQVENKGRFITTGLWSWSRHPNYFGEIMLWVGMFILAVPVLSGWRWIVVVSPVFVYLLLTKISGVGMLERSGKRRWGDDAAYQRYLAATSELVMRPPRTPS